MFGEFQKFVAAAKRDDNMASIFAFLRWFFAPTLSVQPPVGAACALVVYRLSVRQLIDSFRLGVFWDAGLVYRDEQHGYLATCVPANQAMMSVWAVAEGGLAPLSSITVRSFPCIL